MSQKIINLPEDIRKTTARIERRCRSLIRDLRVLKRPISFSEIYEMKLADASRTMYGDARHCVEAQVLLEGDLDVCVRLGWLERSRKQKNCEEKLGSFDEFDVFQATLAAHRLKAQIPSKQPSGSRPPTITVKCSDKGVVAKFRGVKWLPLSHRVANLLHALYIKNGQVLSAFDMEKSDFAFSKSVSLLRMRLRDMKVDEGTIKMGITREPGLGYRINRDFLRITWKSDLGRQSNVLNGMISGRL